jgi:hypothetical protein
MRAVAWIVPMEGGVSCAVALAVVVEATTGPNPAPLSDDWYLTKKSLVPGMTVPTPLRVPPNIASMNEPLK